VLAFVVPSFKELFEFKPLFEIGPFEVTFPTLVMFAITILMGLFFVRAFSKRQLVPVGSQNVGESFVEFVDNQIVLPVLGPEGKQYLPLLTTMFFWVFFNNIMGIIPAVQFPITSRMAYPAVLALLAWVLYNWIGIKEQGFFSYFKGILFPPGVPKVVYILLTPIELISTILVRPLTLAVRLFANMVAGHMLLAVLFLGTAVFFQSGIGKVTFLLPFALGTVLTGFEIFVAGMQAFIITILTAVYIAGAAHPEH
jgi:F-type H+-transporting ATPase subunit a